MCLVTGEHREIKLRFLLKKKKEKRKKELYVLYCGEATYALVGRARLLLEKYVLYIIVDFIFY